MAKKLDVRRMLLEDSAPETGDETFDLSGRDFSGFAVAQPVAFHYEATPKNGALTLRLRFTARLAAECARCLAPAQQELFIENEYRLRESDWQQPVPELPFDPNGVLDLEELAYGEVVLEAPQVLLCSEECEGLCCRCGQPKAACACPAEEAGDPRFAVLKELLKG